VQGLTAEVLSFNGETLSFGYSSIAITFAPAGDITATFDFQVRPWGLRVNPWKM
jgi:hypothetical protein